MELRKNVCTVYMAPQGFVYLTVYGPINVLMYLVGLAQAQLSPSSNKTIVC